MRFGSLFSGIGGMDLGLERAGMRCAWQVEIDPFCRKVLAKHWQGVKRHADIRTFPPEPFNEWLVDLVAGGFPCQPVSQAGKRKAQDDERWLWPEFGRVLGILRPPYAILENVTGLLVRGFGDVLRDLAALGYDAEWDCLPASAFGAPFEGDRLFICATNRSGCQDKRRLIFREKPEPGTWWLSEPGVCRVVDGVSSTVGDGGGNIEVAGLANAVVPQVAEWIGKRIMEFAS